MSTYDRKEAWPAKIGHTRFCHPERSEGSSDEVRRRVDSASLDVSLTLRFAQGFARFARLALENTQHDRMNARDDKKCSIITMHAS